MKTNKEIISISLSALEVKKLLTILNNSCNINENIDSGVLYSKIKRQANKNE